MGNFHANWKILTNTTLGAHYSLLGHLFIAYFFISLGIAKWSFENYKQIEIEFYKN